MLKLEEKQAAPAARQKKKSKQFVPISFDLLDNPDFRNHFMNKKKFRTYLYLRRRVIRGVSYGQDNLPGYGYYCTGYLMTNIPLSELSRTLNISKSTASDHIRQLERDGVIKVETDKTEDGRERSIYILGGHQNSEGEIVCPVQQETQEHWFIDQVFGREVA